MHLDTVRHEKVRFRRDELTCLDSLPSSSGIGRRRRAMRRAASIGGRVAAGLIGACVVAILVAAVLVQAGIGRERMRGEAEAVLARIVGPGHRPAIGGVALTVAGPGLLALEIRDARVERVPGGEAVLEAARIRLGLSPLALLRGAFRLDGIAVEGARLDLAAVPAAARPARMQTGDGLYDPDAVARALFDEVAVWSGRWRDSGGGTLDLTDIEVSGMATSAPLVVEHARLSAAGEAKAMVEAGIAVGRYRADVAATLDLNADDGTVERLRATADVGAAPGFDRLRVSLEGAPAGAGGDVALAVEMRDLSLPTDAGVVAGDLDMTARLAAGSGKVEIDRLATRVGRSQWVFHGAFGPSPAGATPEPTYRFELVSDGSRVSPSDSSEASLDVVARLAGTVAADFGVVDIAEIGVRTGQGEASGNARVRFAGGGAPGISLRLGVADMAVGHAKQLWPWFAAPTSRRWVTDNLYGGLVGSGWVRLDVAPGRLGNGVPLDGSEVAGEFSVARTRFDVAGRIPPVRDGAGRVAFAGADVDIHLDRGTVYMPSGRTVEATNGHLAIRDAHVWPVIGALDIDVAGAADAVLELASYDPIDVESHVSLSPDALSGSVTGKVKADIPLHDGIAEDGLDWLVSLRYAGLAIAEPVDGQRIAEASGTIVVDPGKAVIEATARLNGVPATLSLVEPLGDSGVAASRRIALKLDGKTRDALVPGLNTLIPGGDVALTLADPDPSRRRIEADLSAATLAIPWVGWSKGAGIPATVSFDLREDGRRRELADFTLQGETFAASGSITMAGDRLEAVSFPAMRLTRNDSFSLDLSRRDRGYAVTVRGRSIDARSLIKLYGGASTGGGAGPNAVPVTVDLRVDTVTGFHGEMLNDVTLRYAGNGDRADSVSFTASTAGGARVALSDGQDGEGRAMSIESADAGALLRFLDLYERMRGGSVALVLRGPRDGPLRGRVDARDFSIVDEPRIATLVSTPPARDGRSLNQAVRGELDTSVVAFELAHAEITRSPGSLAVGQGVLRGPMIGATFQGSLYDPQGNIGMTGTFMPAYGLNRIFGEIPLVGVILGNGRDRGLIGITFRLSGPAAEPRLDVNPLSVIAPGIFRSVFEFR